MEYFKEEKEIRKHINPRQHHMIPSRRNTEYIIPGIDLEIFKREMKQSLTKEWILLERQKNTLDWYVEMNLTGGQVYFSFPEIQHEKNIMERRKDGYEYKVINISKL